MRELLDRQSGVVSRAQLLEFGLVDHDVRRLVRRRSLARVHPGVYVNHTGPLPWTARAWAAVLAFWPAVITGESAVRLAGDLIHVGVDHRRDLRVFPGVRVHRLRRFDERAQLDLHPPRDRFEEALIDLASGAKAPDEALTVIADACQRGRTTPDRVRATLRLRSRVRHGAWLRAALDDVAVGAYSALESRYLNRVERAHGLPRGLRQRRCTGPMGAVYRDVEYVDQGVIVELDGRWHREDARTRWDDMGRDLAAAGEDRLTIRLGWRHCDRDACPTAAQLTKVLRARGWSGTGHPCGPRCSLGAGSQPTGD